VTGVPSDSFNAAGVHPATLEPYHKSRAQGDRLVNNYHTKGEALTTLQESAFKAVSLAGDAMKRAASAVAETVAAPLDFVRSMLGVKVSKEPYRPFVAGPTAIGKQHQLPSVDKDGNPVSLLEDAMSKFKRRHSVDVVVNGLELQKKEDLGTIAAIL
jgi:hypothetical protein